MLARIGAAAILLGGIAVFFSTASPSAQDFDIAPPTLTGSVSNGNVTLSWTPPTTGDIPTSYIIEAGSAPGYQNIASFDTQSSRASLYVPNVPAGRYYVRIRSRGPSGISAPSNEVVLDVTSGGCTGVAQQPTPLTGNSDGMALSFSWRQPQSGPIPTSYVIEAGTAPGLSNLATLDTGSTARFFAASAPPGTYYVRVRSKNACGSGPPSNEVAVTSGETVPEGVTIVMSDIEGNRLVRFDDLAGSNWEVGPRGPGQSLNKPWHIAIDSRRRIYVADRDNNRLVRMDDLSGAGFVTFSGSGDNQLAPPGCSGNSNPPIGCVFSVSVDAADRIYITGNGGIIRIDDMTGAGWVRLAPSNGSPFNNPKTVAFDAQGRIYVADTDNYRVARIDNMQGSGLVTFGSRGNGVGQFDRPEGLAIDSLGRIYITDNENHRIVRINDMSGAGWVAYGSFGSGRGQFYEPHDIAVSDGMMIYVDDTGNGRVVRLDDMTGGGWKSFGARKQQPSGCPVTTCELPGTFEFIASKGIRLLRR